MQMKGLMLAKSDAVGGLLQSEVQPRAMRCGNNVYLDTAWEAEYPCTVWTRMQLTVTPDGTIYLSTRYSFTAYTRDQAPPISRLDQAVLQTESDQMLDFILGKSKQPLESLPRAPSTIQPPPPSQWGSAGI